MLLQAALETVAQNPNLILSGLIAALGILWRIDQQRCTEDRKKLWEALEDNKTMVLTVIAKLGPSSIPPPEKDEPA